MSDIKKDNKQGDKKEPRFKVKVIKKGVKYENKITPVNTTIEINKFDRDYLLEHKAIEEVK